MSHQPYGYNKDAPESVPWIPVPRLSDWKRVKASWAGVKIETRTMAHAILPSIIAPVRAHQYSKAIEKSIIRLPNLRRILDHPIEAIRLIFMAKNHTHRDAAQLRTSTNIKMSEIVREAGFTPYTVSMSANDKGIGARLFYTPKDLSIPFRQDEIPDNAVLLFTDVDYYADMNKWLKLFKPMIIYTMAPETAAYRGKDYSYYIKDDVVHYSVSGGATYKHQIWDYKGDTVCIVGRHGQLLTYHITQHKIDKDPNRRLITIIPATITAYPHYCCLKYTNGLKRRQFTFKGKDGKIKKNVLYNTITDVMSISENGSPHSVELSGTSYHAIKERLGNKTAPPVIADVERILSQDKVERPHILAAILFSLVDEIDYSPNIITTTKLPTFYQPLTPLITEDGANPGKAFSNPLTNNPSLFPARSHNSDTAAINGRVLNLKNEVVPPPKYKRYLDEFVDLMVPEPGIGSPWTVDQVRRAQNAPTQVARARLTEASMSTISKNRLASMLKAEAVVGTNDPRNITTCSPEHTIGMSSFVYPFKNEILKKLPWYGPTKTPPQICKRLGIVCKNGGVLTDYNRLDGTMSKFTHQPYYRSMMRWLRQDYREEYDHWHKECFIKKACTSTGLKYDAGDGTRSGSSITTDTNTCGCGFVCYCALRDLGFTPKEAWELIGIICGDDGVNDNIEGLPQAMEKCATDMGLSLKVEVVQKNEPIKYCSRIFVDPLTCRDSFQDPFRCIPKLHLTANKNVTDTQAAINKAVGYLITDHKTPIIGDWCRKVISLCGTSPKDMTRDEVIKCTMAWPQDNPDLIREEFCKILDLTGQELQHAIDTIHSVKSLNSFPVLLTINHKHKLPAVVGSDIVGPTQCIETKVSNTANTPKVTLTDLQESLNKVAKVNKTITIAPIPAKRTNLVKPVPAPRNLKVVVDVHQSDPTPRARSKINQGATPKVTNIKGKFKADELHAHVCKTCQGVYTHYHRNPRIGHKQFDSQCPYPNCADYFDKRPETKHNPTGSNIVSADEAESHRRELEQWNEKPPMPNRSRKRTNDGRTPASNTSKRRSDSKQRRPRPSRTKAPTRTSGTKSTSKTPSTQSSTN
jgi:hypothetical protein